MPKCLKKYVDKEKARNYRYRHRKNNYRKSEKNATNNYCRYSLEDCEKILAHNIPDIELSKEIGRSVRAIHAKRGQLRRTNFYG